MLCDICGMMDEVLHDGNLLWFNKLQPAGCNRVSPACSVLVYTICIVLSVMIFLYSDHNNCEKTRESDGDYEWL